MKSLLLLLLIGVPTAAQTVTPNFTTGSMTQTTSATQTVTETSVIERFGGTVQTWNGDNVKAIKTNSSGNLVGPVDITGTDTQFHVVDSDLPWQLEIITRDAGLIETESINRTIDTETITNTLSVFSQ
tara:strand:- start:442 stop:825 length:384 start_codon:yes stop_codon:yes gene_type:complete